jgi:hypothetical protein
VTGTEYHDGNPLHYAPDEVAAAAEPGITWDEVDLGPILRGETKQPEPAVGLARSDGLKLLYAGKEHTVIGEMESGKSWYCCLCAAAELMADHHVVYIHFEEADPTGTVERLRIFGVPDEVIIDQFHFVGPNEPARAEWLAALVAWLPSLTVLDGINEAMSMHTMEIRDEDGVAAFRRRLVKPFTAVGSAVLGADHVVKDREKRGRSPLGSIHKGNGLTGSLILLEIAEPFGRGERGRSHVYVTKDRPGYLRRHGKRTKTPGKTFVGELVVDDSWHTPEPEVRFWAPKDDEPAVSPNGQPDGERVLKAVELVTGKGLPVNLRNVRGACAGISNGRIDVALTALVLDGRLIEGSGARGARVFTVPQDHSSSTAAGAP